MDKVIIRLKGGLGNQLFSYAAAKSLSHINGSELVIDNISGFVRDRKYNRHYQLKHFNISARLATSSERMEPFGRLQRHLMKKMSTLKKFEIRKYIEQEKNDYDDRFLKIQTKGAVYLDGYWQSEQYFVNIENIIRKEFVITPPTDERNNRIAEHIRSLNAVCLHIRWFDKPNIEKGEDFSNNIEKEYYEKAISLICTQTSNPHFFIFSDYPSDAVNFFSDLNEDFTVVNHNQGDESAYADLWLMSMCKHFVIANSTFSWWAAWL
jgi:hypothetical protein